MRVALVAGPGGSGVTTVAALTAVSAVACGDRTVLVSSDPSLPQILGDGNRPGLTVVRPDPAADLAAVRPALTGLLRTLGVDDPVEPADLAGQPGSQELATMIAVARAARSGDCATLVLDAGSRPAELLAVPETIGRLVDLVAPAPVRILRQVGGLLGGRSRTGTAGAGELVETLLDRLLLARAVLTETTGVALHLVTAGGPRRRAAAAAMVPVLAVGGVGLGRVIRNGVGRLDDAEPAWPAPVLSIPQQSDEPAGETLDSLSRSVFGDSDPLDVVPGPALIDPQVDRTDDGFRIGIPVPMADRGALDLVRSGDDVLITVHSRTRRIELPPVLRRCRVTGAALDAGVLTVSFRPDPAQWPKALQADGADPSAAGAAVTAEARG